MSARLYTSVDCQLVKITLLPGPKTDSHLLDATDTSVLGEGRNTTSAAAPVSSLTEVVNNSSKTTLLAKRYQFSTKSGKFEPHGEEITLTLGASSETKLVALSRVTDNRTGLQMPCLVVQQREGTAAQHNLNQLSSAGDGSGHFHKYRMLIIFLSLKKTKFIVWASVMLAHSLLSATKVFIRDGPVICWEHQGHVYITQACSLSNRTKVDVVKLDECLWKPSNTLKWFGQLNEDVVAVGTEQPSAQEHGGGDAFFDWGRKWVVVKLAVRDSKFVTTPVADGCNIVGLPHEYSNFVNCVHLCKNNRSESGQSTCTLKSRELRETPSAGVVLAATNQFQLVEASAGIIRRVCDLPFSDACSISVAMVTGGEELIVVHSTSGGVCAVWGKSFKVAGEWTGFRTVVIDDFLFSGVDQVLLLGDCEDAPQKSFCLTDLGTCNWTTKKDSEGGGPSKTALCAGNLLSAIQALEAQTQTGMAALRASELRCDLKAQLIKKSRDALHKMVEPVVGHPPSSALLPSSSLVCICDLSGETSISEGGEDVSTVTEDATLKCLSGWQRVVGDHWIVGVEVHNQTDRSISDICISLTPASRTQSSLQSATSTCNFKSVVSSAAAKSTPSRPRGVCGEPAGKRLRLDENRRGNVAVLEPGLKMTVLGVTGLPEFISQPAAQCYVVLNWKELLCGDHMDVVNERDESRSATDKDEFAERRHTCGIAVLHASDVATGKLGINPLDPTKPDCGRQHDLQALDAVQLTTPLLLTSRYSSLRCVESALTGPMGFQQLAAPHGIMSPSGPLGMTRVQIASQDGPCKMGMTVCSRNQSDLLLFCQHLYQLLPDDVIIKPLPPAYQIKSTIATAVSAIDKELSHTCSHLQQLIVSVSSSMVRGQDARGITEDDSRAGTSNEDKRAKVRDDFEKKRSRWQNTDTYYEVGDSDEVQSLRRELMDLRMATDAHVSDLASALSVGSTF